MAMGLPCSGHTTAMAVQPNDPTAPLLVACLCAQWCGLCRDYAPLMKATLAQFDAAQAAKKRETAAAETSAAQARATRST